MKVAILGTGNIGTDILIKVLRSNYLKCEYFVGKNPDSIGLNTAKKLGVQVSANGLDFLLEHHRDFDLVFDATSASAHYKNYEALKKLNKKIINLTPAKIGEFCIPVLNIEQVLHANNINMVTCGGQASIPIIYSMAKGQKGIEYVEVVSSLSSKSAGMATRENIDEYLSTTEKAIKLFSGCISSKAILNINPALPEVNMKTTIRAIIKNHNFSLIEQQVQLMVEMVQKYVPGYEIVIPPYVENDRVTTMIQVIGAGDFLPAYAGNLDIITSAAVTTAELIAEYTHEHKHYRYNFA